MAGKVTTVAKKQGLLVDARFAHVAYDLVGIVLTAIIGLVINIRIGVAVAQKARYSR